MTDPLRTLADLRDELRRIGGHGLRTQPERDLMKVALGLEALANRALAAHETPEPACTCSTAPNSLCRRHHYIPDPQVAHETPEPRLGYHQDSTPQPFRWEPRTPPQPNAPDGLITMHVSFACPVNEPESCTTPDACRQANRCLLAAVVDSPHSKPPA